MTDLVVTAASCVANDGAAIEHGTAGEAISAGKVVYRDSSTGKYGLADSNSATAGIRVPRGLALNTAALNQPLAIARSGPVTLGATMSAGATYYLSETPGGIEPSADLGTGEYPTVLGIAISTTVLDLNIQSAGVAL